MADIWWISLYMSIINLLYLGFGLLVKTRHLSSGEICQQPQFSYVLVGKHTPRQAWTDAPEW